MVNAIVRDVHVDTVIVAESCCVCGVVFGLGEGFKKERLNDHKIWCCPNGHEQHYTGKSEAERLREQLKWAESSKQSWRDQAETAERRRRAEKAAKTRLKNRIAAGVCPCCHRSFPEVARHIAEKHPGFEGAS